MKKVLLILSMLIILCFISCSKQVEDDILVIGTNAEYPPFEYKVNDEFKGVDMELAKMIVKRLGLKYRIIDMDFDALIPSLTSKKIDLAISAITITDERSRIIDFSKAYYTADQAIICNLDSEINIKSVADLADFSIGVQNSTTGQIYIDENFISKNLMDKDQLQKYSTNIEAITDMLKGNVDLVIIDDSAAMGYGKLKPVKTVFTIQTDESYGIGLIKGSPLKVEIDTAIDEILKSDEWAELISRYM